MSFLEFLLSGLSNISDWSQEKSLGYLRQLQRTSIYLLGSTALLFLLLVLGVVTRQTWLISAVVLIVGVAAGVFLLLATPLAIPTIWTVRTFETVKTYVTFVAAALLWLLLFGLYLSIVPISNNPKAIVLVFLLASIFALLWARFGLGPRIRNMYTSVVVIFLLTTVGFLFPKSFEAAGSLGQRLDEQIAEFLSNPSRFLARRPESPPPRPVDLESIPTLEFFNTVTGEPQYWYYQTATDEYEVYNNPGFHFLTGDSLRAVTREVATDILRWYSARQPAPSEEPPSTESSSNAPRQPEPLADFPVGSRLAVPDLSIANAVHQAVSPSDLHLRRAVLDESTPQGGGTFRIRTLPSTLSFSPVFAQIRAEVSPNYFLTAKVHTSQKVGTWELQGLGFHFLISPSGSNYLLYESEEREYDWKSLPFEIETGPVTMGLRQSGRQIQVFLNSRLVDSFELWESPSHGRVGLFFKGPTGGGGSVTFSGLAVYDLGG